MQGIIGLIETGNLVHVRRTDQSTIKPVRPGMIRTLDREGMTACILFQPRSTMTADIVKTTDVRLLVARHDQTFVRNRGNEVITCPWNLTLMADQDPVL